MKVRVVCRKVYDYIRYDLREIAFPSSLPDPPHIQKRPKLTWRDNLFATKLYCASWVRDIGPDLRPNDYAKDNEANGEAKTTSSAQEKEPSVVEDLGQFDSLSLSNWGIYGLVVNLLFKCIGFGSNHILSRGGSKIWMKQATFQIEGSYSACAFAVAARGGMETLRPALQRVYMTRASAYRDALKSFIQGYQEGVQQAYSILVSAHLYKGLYMGKQFFFSNRLSIVIAAVIISASVVAGSTWYGSATDLVWFLQFNSFEMESRTCVARNLSESGCWTEDLTSAEAIKKLVLYLNAEENTLGYVEGGELDVDPRTLKAKA
ncbi:hypothetical protein POTOM_051632 [Populus tomentosa]|uniref:Uncharacterized protein n=1 Tax=Populus tomentosa TaxID=118781 RepID=A0A8X7Y6E6_POPTO|nr:hypothetical protein POTOM_051632 [Populus tomentosa]